MDQTIGTAAGFFSDLEDVLLLGADAYWKADEFDCIRHVALIGGGGCRLMPEWLEGQSLRALIPAADLSGREFRAVRSVLGDRHRRERVVELSGLRRQDGIWRGLARSVPDSKAGSFQTARALLDQVETAREREAEQRREAEIVLDGLRILTGGGSRKEIFGSLLALLAPALEFDDALVLSREWSGAYSVAMPTRDALADLDWRVTGSRLFDDVPSARTFHVPDDLELPVTEAAYRSALSVGLSGGSRPSALLCLHRKARFFEARHLGLATRLSLVASQAHINEEERQKVLQTSKLAALGELAAGIIHEINQPLTAMTLALDTLSRLVETEDDLPRQSVLERLLRLQKHAGRLTDVVAHMRVLSHRSSDQLSRVSLRSTVDGALGIARHKLNGAGIATDIDVAPELAVLGNATELGQVVLNLLSNAHDAIVAEGAPIKDKRISICASTRSDGVIELAIRDSGAGFPPANPERAFEPFFTTKPAGKGTGLGLALCRRIVENMGGTISLGNWTGGAEVRIGLRAGGSAS